MRDNRDNGSRESKRTFTRRSLISKTSLGATALLAGCSGDSDDGNQSTESGGRVPELKFEYWTGFGDTSALFEDIGPIIADNIREHLGVSVDFYPKEGITSQSEIVNDERNANMIISGAPASPQALDPDSLYSLHAKNAGANSPGVYNFSHYADCEFSTLVEQQRSAPNPEKRQELVQEASKIASNDVVWMNLFARVYHGAHRSELNIDSGEGGLVRTNPYPIIDAETNGQNIAINCPMHTLQTLNHLGSRDLGYLHLMNNLVYSPLLKWNRDLEIETALAEDYEVRDENRTFEFTLRDATFHNGQPITAEDVKFTFELIENNYAQMPNADSYPYESITVEDDRTVVVNLSESRAPWLNILAPFWGILPKDIWEEGTDNALEFEPDPIVGSGPVEITDFQQNQAILMEPYEDHWNTPSAPVELVGYQDAQGEATALQNSNLTVLSDIPADIAYDQLKNTEGVTVETWETYEGYFLTPMMHFGPTKFREFRMAISQVLDREQITEVGTRGDADPTLHSFRWPQTHPVVQEFDDGTLTKIAETATPNPDVARNILEEAGWTWDDEDRLHYPDDADLEPMWPQGSGPGEQTDQFPCLGEQE